MTAIAAAATRSGLLNKGELMSTKFSVRPAPRKRPWICKRSPPCLPPPPFPPSLTCTFALQRRQPPPPQTQIGGSLLLLSTAPHTRYRGRWDSGFDYFELIFHYDPTTATGWGEAYWSAGPTSDHGNFPELPVKLPPFFLYQATDVVADNWDWWIRLLITT